ncbi:MAG: GlcNAc-PI de-N-acetylase [Caldilineae bacterium]|nr:MAG: GlcNAc-PI de-N-acetylase [Caldilineae bacterium]
MNPPPIETIAFHTEPASRRLLVAFAHPDDESFGPAGTLIRYAHEGVAVHYVCGTRGEAGSVDPHLLPEGSSLADLRTRELLCAAPILGLAGLHFLNYHDSGMENTPANQNPRCLVQAPVEEVAEKITRLIRQIQPQVVLTFDPTGGYFHPDHIHMHRATTLAFRAAGDPSRFPHHLEEGLAPYAPQKLYYTAFPRGFLKIVVRILPLFGQDPAAFGRNRDINLKRIADVQQTVTTKIYVAPHYHDARRAAACHVSQISGGPGRLPGFIQRWLARYDTFTRAIPPPSPNGRLESDLFEGITD